LMIASPASHAEEEYLSHAYKKEFAFLEAERASLEQRLKQTSIEAKSSIRSAEASIRDLQAQLLGISAQADALTESLIDLERQGEKQTDQIDTIASTLSQATATLEKFGIQVPQTPPDDAIKGAKALSIAFSEAVKILTDLGKVRKESGDFFLSDGTRTTGEIVFIGNVARYGLAENAGGALAPAGGGRMKVWEPNSYAAALALSSGNPPALLPIYLFENTDRAVEKKEGKTVGAVVESGGVIAYVIVAIGFLALGMILLRIWFLFRSSSRTDELVAQLTPLVKEGWRDEALKVCQANASATSRVLAATIRNLDRRREQLEDLISEAILHETPYLERFGSIILVLASIAPLLGLLGTVTGMISTFDVITEFGTGDPKMLSGGISEALVTTELGLIVAIPTLLLGNILTGWSNRIKSSMEHAALRITNTYEGLGLQKEKFASDSISTNPSADISET
jgi:biopolymer transport protein ExbB